MAAVLVIVGTRAGSKIARVSSSTHTERARFAHCLLRSLAVSSALAHGARPRNPAESRYGFNRSQASFMYENTAGSKLGWIWFTGCSA
jgi:hypothetical protein